MADLNVAGKRFWNRDASMGYPKGKAEAARLREEIKRIESTQQEARQHGEEWRAKQYQPRIEQLKNELSQVQDGSSWVEVSSAMFDTIRVGKKYRFDNRVGRVVEKSGSPGANARGIAINRPMVRVEWD